MFTIEDIMSTELSTLGPDDSLYDARRLMTEQHIRHIPIVDEQGGLLGIVSHRDVLAAADSILLANDGELQEREKYVALSEIMTDSVSTVDERASLRGAALHLQMHKLGCLPVTRDGRLHGIITDSDFVAVCINLLEQLEYSEPIEQEA